MKPFNPFPSRAGERKGEGGITIGEKSKGTLMNETTILQNLEAIAEKLNLKVSYENLRKLRVFSRGGLYRFKDDRTVLIEKSLILSDKIDTLADALAQFDLESIYIPPAVRKILVGKTTTPTDENRAESAAAPEIHPGDHRTPPD